MGVRQHSYGTHHLGIVLLRAKRYEKVLREEFHAQGSGLGSLARYCGWKLSRPLRAELAYFVPLRNEMIHSDELQRGEGCPAPRRLYQHN